MAGRHLMLLAVAVAIAVAGVRAGPLYGNCTHNNHCEPLSCCRVGLMRYSAPSCYPLGNVGSPCSPAYFTPEARTLTYPNGYTVEIEEAYFGPMCPCRSGLICTQGSCQPDPNSAPSHSYEYNSISSEYD